MNKPINRQLQEEKLALAHRASEFLVSHVSTIKAVAVTGSVAHGDVSIDDDLDFCIITAKNRLWTTRFFCYAWAILLRKKRVNNRERDSWCLNLFLDEMALLIPLVKRTDFAAKQLREMKILYDPEGLFGELRAVNASWLAGQKQPDLIIELVKCQNLGDVAENFWRMIQMAFMRHKITREVVSSRQIFFHPLERV